MQTHEPAALGSKPAAPEASNPAVEVSSAPVLRATAFPSLVGKALLGVAHVQTAIWDRAAKRVEQEQERALAELVAHARGTEFGRAHGFERIRRYADFARQVPIGDYDSFSPYIERMRKGERGLVVPEFIRYYGNSSGSSNQGRQKFLPIGERQISYQKKAGADALMRYLAHKGDARYPTGYTLGLFPPITMRAEGPVLITSNPALMVTRMPKFTAPMYLPHDEIKRVPEYERRLGIIAERYLDYDVRSISGTTCWFTLMLQKVIEAARRRGRSVSTVREIWPNLKVMLGGGVSADPYLPILERLMGTSDFTLVDTYNATEGGLFAATDFTGAPGMLMIPHRGTFFEFVPMDERDKPNPTRVPLWGVERDRLYSILVTTVSGLYAYEIGDIVRFPSIAPHRIEFAGRTAGCLSVTQELTTHIEIEQAVAYAIKQVPCRTLDFGAAADVGVAGTAKSRYVLYAEFDASAEPKSLEQLAAAFDEGLGKLNRVYREHRAGDVAILPPIVVALARGGAQRFLHEVTNGNVQGKFPRILSEARREKLLAYIRQDPTVS